jgi:hypothetical protein
MSNTFAAASHLSVHLARWENIRTPPDGRIGPPAGSPSTWLVGADEGRHGSEFSSQLATEFIAVGAHPDADSATACAAAAVPEFDGAAEVWSAAFEPLRSIGELNWVGGGRLEATGSRADGPLAVMTSVGWDLGPAFDAARALAFAGAVAEVRQSMWDDPPDGMSSHQNFTFPGVLIHDGITLTTWRDVDAMKAYAYQPGAHKSAMDAFRIDETADRTSFTRLRPLETHGTWWGIDPFGW